MMGVVGAAVAIVFGFVWTLSAANMGAPSFFPVFGILFIIIGVVNLIYNYKNATGENRFSVFDITTKDEEQDPLDKYIKKPKIDQVLQDKEKKDISYCPYCGAEVEDSYDYCTQCGKKIPSNN